MSLFAIAASLVLTVACEEPTASEPVPVESALGAQAATSFSAMMRVVACNTDPDDLAHPRMEVYLPESLGDGEGSQAILDKLAAAGVVIGSYILDLTPENKGKSIEPVKVSVTTDKKGIVVDQFTRGLPKTTVPVAGGVVDFDHRFAEQATCVAFGAEPEFKR
jgi:hypothetical protein